MIRLHPALKHLERPAEESHPFFAQSLIRAALFDRLFDQVYAEAAAVTESRGEAETLTMDFFAELSRQVSAGLTSASPGRASEPGRTSLN